MYIIKKTLTDPQATRTLSEKNVVSLKDSLSRTLSRSVDSFTSGLHKCTLLNSLDLHNFNIIRQEYII